MAIDTVIFDLGGVLIDWNPDYIYNSLIPDPEKRAYFYKEVCPPHWNENQDAGYPLQQAMADRREVFPEWANEINAYYGNWVNMLGDPLHHNVASFYKVLESNKYLTLALTNWSAETLPWARVLPRFNFLNDFHGLVVSGKEKSRKPFLDFYQIMINRYRLVPEKCLFIDDNFHNIEAANALKINTIHYVPDTDLELEFEKFGLNF